MAATNDFFAARLPPKFAALRLSVPPAWAPLIDDYVRRLAAGGQRPATLRLRRDHLNQLARALDCPRGAVTADMLVDWFGTQTWALEARRNFRSSVTKFFGMGLQDTPP